MSTRLSVDFGPEWRRAVEALRVADHRIPAEVDDTLRAAAYESVRRAQAKVLAMPVKGTAGHSGLRARVASGVGVQKRRRGSYRITTSMPPGQEGIPRGIQSRWSHPVYGRGRVFQAHHWDWFQDSIVAANRDTAGQLHVDLEKMAKFIDTMTNGR